jgi:hypothetical protein
MWLQRARAFATHGIEQTLADAAHTATCVTRFGPAIRVFAIYLWDCIRGRARFRRSTFFFSNVPTSRGRMITRSAQACL